MARLADAAGGNSVQDIGNGPEMQFLGYPVRETQVLPGSGAVAGDKVCYFGDLSLASTLGLRRDVSIQTSNEVKFIEDQIAVKGTERVAITVHEGVDASPVGPVVGLALAAS
jgi:HK97 family phage major capsid protein